MKQWPVVIAIGILAAGMVAARAQESGACDRRQKNLLFLNGQWSLSLFNPCSFNLFPPNDN
jgi:hypothetical protein